MPPDRDLQTWMGGHTAPAESGVNHAAGPLLSPSHVTPHLLNPWETRLGD